MKILVIIWAAITTRGPVGWFRNLFYIIGNYRNDLEFLANGVDQCLNRAKTAERYVKKATKIHVDIPPSLKDRTKVIVIGNYRNKDHVQVFTLRPGSIDMLIDQLRDMQRYAEIERVDAATEISATVKRSLIV